MKVLIPVVGQEIAPRFDLATEVMIVKCGKHGDVEKSRVVVLPQGSADELCHFIVKEGVDVVICGAIEEEYFQYLLWKKIQVFDSVIGNAVKAVQYLIKGALLPGKIID
ncbi:MAG: NifB/NifX family molybdenum-iron cluster-binding protein [Thermodesulforhabdaceae bacterium]